MIIETVPRTLAAQQAPTSQTVRRPRPFLLGLACWGYLVVLLGVLMVMRQSGDRSWMATVLLLSPRWLLALPLALLWPWILWTRRWWMAALATGATYVLLFPVLGMRVGMPGGGERGQVRLLTCNVHRQQLDPKALANFIAEVQPDVVALQDWSDVNKDLLFQGNGWNVHREDELLIASRYPITRVIPVDLTDGERPHAGDRDGAAAVFELAGPMGPLHVLNLHLDSPHTGLISFGSDQGAKLSANIERRRRESEIVRGAAERVAGPLLLAGDFNTTDDSPIFQEAWTDYADAFSEAGIGFGYTYLINLTQLRIDHVLADSSWTVERCWVGPNVGSPHRPLVADLNAR